MQSHAPTVTLGNSGSQIEFVWSCSSRTNKCDEDLPALLGCAEEDLDEALTLRRLQDEIPMYQMFSSVTTLRSMGLVEVNVGRCEQGLAKVWVRLADLRVCHCEKLVWD